MVDDRAGLVYPVPVMLTRMFVIAMVCAALLAGCSRAEYPATPAGALVKSLAMADIPAGEFRMGDVTGNGDPDELPVHTVSIRAFRLAKTELTVAEFRRFSDATGYQTDAERNANGRFGCIALDADPIKSVYVSGLSWRNPGFVQSERQPVVCVSYADVQAFIVWLNRETGPRYRLPTEAEWEYAARAGSGTTFVWGDDPQAACRYANAADNTPGPGGETWSQKIDCVDGFFHTAPVGMFKPNALGLYDMAGNAWEWTADCYQPTYAGAPTDGSAWSTPECPKRSIRGSAWPYPAGFLRVANRGGSNAELRANDRGFRLAE